MFLIRAKIPNSRFPVLGSLIWSQRADLTGHRRLGTLLTDFYISLLRCRFLVMQALHELSAVQVSDMSHIIYTRIFFRHVPQVHMSILGQAIFHNGLLVLILLVREILRCQCETV
jgi:hypothetical protein